ncbi:MAG: diphosphate--fructose-6-phosphate 1-phosphotransferase [Candidatus Melainabacteria bacterium RIFOXYA12_FULL_32_12]|nr:MAG: diphosphate--fructose-6-phosphate 1-phosphotransferase [Candidatus Melainabacteria bacterium RIFOXYA2_FULL_32_9]OGI26192.1 MAG: diphosphate--fructose-6-phosphate 1-phosphotransferase [Candidatus Melainabacteria bacterium RIFOXYA12_FULL_32_12]
MTRELSALQKARLEYKPKLPKVLRNGVKNLDLECGAPTQSIADADDINEMFPNSYGKPVVTFKSGESKVFNKTVNVGVILSGGQAPGGHNVIAGLFDALKEANPNNKLYGFLGGPAGIIDGKYVEITKELIDEYRNTGGFDIIGSGRTKLESEEQFMKTWNTCQNLNVSAVVVIGGDDSNTNAALLAEFFLEKKAGIQVIGVPKTIDGDLKNEQIEISFGFDTATKTYAELIGNIERDANSAKKYWHFIKVMGRSASHVGLECALQTHPNITLISEEVAQNKTSLGEIVDYIVNIVVERSNRGKNFGVAIIPEGIIEFIPEMKSMISNLNDKLALCEDEADYQALSTQEQRIEYIKNKLETSNSKVFASLPSSIQAQLLMDRDPHGNVQVSRIETEKLLVEMVQAKLTEMKKNGQFKGKFSSQTHFFGYEGRCAAPSNFDADYCYSLGYNAFALVQFNITGYLSSVKNLTKPADEWIAGGVPLTMLMNMEKRHGIMKPVIQKALVDINGPVFGELQKNREAWAYEDHYLFTGPIQYYGPSEVADVTTKTLQLERK